MESRVEAYWRCVERRLPTEEFVEGEELEPRPSQGDESGIAGDESEWLGGPTWLRRTLRPEYYFYRSLRQRDAEGRWGIFILSGGLSTVTECFSGAIPERERAERLAIEFLNTCGDAHYRFDVYAMSCEGLLRRRRYAQYQREATLPGHVNFEHAYVYHRAHAWAAGNGLEAEVERIFRDWTDDDRGWHWGRRRVCAYVSTVLLDGYGALTQGLRFDQAEWADCLPTEFADECPKMRLASTPAPVLNPARTKRTSEQWLRRWGVSNYSRFDDETWGVLESVRIIGERFEDGLFPVNIRDVVGDFELIDTNVRDFWQAMPSVVRGSANLSSEKPFDTFSLQKDPITFPDGSEKGIFSGCPGELRLTVLEAGPERVPGKTSGAVLALYEVEPRLIATSPLEEHADTRINWIEVLRACDSKDIPEFIDRLICTGCKSAARMRDIDDESQ
ncbi:hypothetical protein PQQ72_15720 [Paraburkholderia strydomiana]|uniref:hypothetical protein n=1 Tax=Paraburkholderia strydomiana TaxID=1245417 RepID=UPI0038BCFE7A